MMNAFSLEGKTILVTGSSSGIGRGIAVECSKMGARIILNGRDENRLNETLGMLEGKGHQILVADISKQEEISFESTVKKYKLSQETIDQFKKLIDEYNIPEWIGKPVAPPEVINGSNADVSSLTLRFADGTSAGITFRETDKETGEEAAKAFRKLFFASANDESLISEENIYPTIKDCYLRYE